MHSLNFVLMLIMICFGFSSNGYISGTIIDENNNPLPGCNVYFYGYNFGTATDSEGYFKIDNLEEGKYTLLVDFIGYKQGSFTFYISEFAKNVEINSDDYLSKLGIGNIKNTNEIIKQPYHEDIFIILKPDPIGADEVTVSASKFKQKITKAPSIALNINERNIRRKAGVFNYNRLVSGLKGVDVMFYGAEGAQLNTRGLASSYSQRFKQYYDGIDLADVIYGTVNSMTFSPPREAISKIEVLYGPQSTLYGPDATNGLSNIIPKDPRTDSSSEINISLNSNNMNRVGGRYAKNLDNVAFDILFEAMESPEYNYGNIDTNAQGEFITPVSFFQLNAFGNYDTIPARQDLFSDLDQRRNSIEGNIYFNLFGGSLKTKTLLSMGDGYLMASTTPTYHIDSELFLQDFKFHKDNHFFRTTYRQQAYYFMNLTGIAGDMARFAYYSDSTFTLMDRFNAQKDDVDKPFYKSLFFDYQYNYILNSGMKILIGTDSRIVNHNYGMRDMSNSFDKYEVRNGVFSQVTYELSDNIEITSSFRIDNHEVYGMLFSPRQAFVIDAGNNNSFKFISGKSYKVPNIFDQNSYSLNENFFTGVLHPFQYPFYPVSMFEGSMEGIEATLGDELIIENEIWPDEFGPYDSTMWPDAFGSYPFGESNWNSGEVIINPSFNPENDYFSMDVLNTGNHSGFTIHDYIDNNQNLVFDEGDSLILTKEISALKPEILTQSEIGFTKLVNKNLMLDLNGYVGKYKNYKSVSENIAQGGEYWVKTYAMDEDSVAFIEALYRYPNRRYDVINNYDGYFPTKSTNIWSYRNLDVSAIIWGLEGQVKYINDIGEFSLNFSYFNDDDLVQSRKKAEEYEKCIDGCNDLEEYKDFIDLYSNTSNFKYSLSTTFNSVFNIDGLGINFDLKGNKPYDFVSGSFRATKEQENRLSSHAYNTSYFEDKGQVGGGITMDLNINYILSQYSINLGVNNITESQTFTFPLSPQLPRTFVFELGYKF